MIEVRDHFRKLSNLLRAQAAVAAGTGHASTTGDLRELIIRSCLRPHLPRTFEVLSGVIIDSTGAKSPQQDCIIVDTRFPRIDVGSDDKAVIIAESVVATIEVKSLLKKDDLLESLANAARVKALKRHGIQQYFKGPAEIRMDKPLPIITYIFAFDGTDPRILCDHIRTYYTPEKSGDTIDRYMVVDAICVLSQGVVLFEPLMPVVVGNNITLPRLQGSQFTMSPLKFDALFAFYRRLHSDLTYLRMLGFDLDPYYAAGELQ